MSLVTAQGRVENAHQNQILLLAPAQVMAIMLVEHIHVTGSNRIDITLHVFDFAFPCDAVTRLQVIAILQQ
ncbi:hypothetical protein D3C77_685570 [compost metagenome]